MLQFIAQQHRVVLVQIGGPVLDLHLLCYLQHYRSPPVNPEGQ